ncbi:MAG: precorrin-8X methylmutase [Clostridia bacterium]
MTHLDIEKPQDIEKRSFEIIGELLGDRTFPAEQVGIVKRVIHTSADFDYADNLVFGNDAVQKGIAALKEGCTVITDTNMALSGINATNLKKFNSEKVCFIADPAIAAAAKENGTTRAVQSMIHASELKGNQIFAIGNAPTALIKLYDMIKAGEIAPALVIGVPVGFVNVVESKEMFMELDTPYIVAKGRKGGSNVAAAIVNALMLEALKA